MKTATLIRKQLVIAAIFFLFSTISFARTFSPSDQPDCPEIWSGKLEVQGTRLSIVFHLDGQKPTMDSPDQGVKGIPIVVERTDYGGISIEIPSIAASYKGNMLFNKIMGTFTQRGFSLPLTLTPGEQKLARPQTPVGPFP